MNVIELPQKTLPHTPSKRSRAQKLNFNIADDNYLCICEETRKLLKEFYFDRYMDSKSDARSCLSSMTDHRPNKKNAKEIIIHSRRIPSKSFKTCNLLRALIEKKVNQTHKFREKYKYRITLDLSGNIFSDKESYPSMLYYRKKKNTVFLCIGIAPAFMFEQLRLQEYAHLNQSGEPDVPEKSDPRFSNTTAFIKALIRVILHELGHIALHLEEHRQRAIDNDCPEENDEPISNWAEESEAWLFSSLMLGICRAFTGDNWE